MKMRRVHVSAAVLLVTSALPLRAPGSDTITKSSKIIADAATDRGSDREPRQ